MSVRRPGRLRRRRAARPRLLRGRELAILERRRVVALRGGGRIVRAGDVEIAHDAVAAALVERRGHVLRNRLARVGRALVPGKRLPVVARRTAPVEKLVRERELGLHVPLLRGLQEPVVRGRRIARDEFAVVEHPAVHVLRLRHPRIGRAPQPAQSFRHVRRHALTVDQHHRVIERGETVAARRRIVKLHERRAQIARVVVGHRHFGLALRVEPARRARRLRERAARRRTERRRGERTDYRAAQHTRRARGERRAAAFPAHPRTSCSACRVARSSHTTSADNATTRNPASRDWRAPAVSAAKMPTGTPARRPAASTCSSAAATSGCFVSPRCPRLADRSAGPTNTQSTPGVAAIRSASSTPRADSICTIVAICAFAVCT
ncbi:hypothetical protein BURPS1710b_0360 [Burkholderia pseudomallei 1710b]|uniref:Uncharacterized protein n=1 Tax=Burkholderia pseudomallei (strain 1710b) TaxID=320372 RepID=Q3JXC9_BURP1|nr:hypothetical protein BURPS1710b_0360 [Burkholderia pseudomallei 1710b]